MEGDILKMLTGLGPGGVLAGTWFYLWRQRGFDLDKASAKIDALQAKIVSMLESSLESEPQRRETLSAIGRSIQEQSALLKESLK